jgi:hypothetical protein
MSYDYGDLFANTIATTNDKAEVVMAALLLGKAGPSLDKEGRIDFASAFPAEESLVAEAEAIHVVYGRRLPQEEGLLALAWSAWEALQDDEDERRFAPSVERTESGGLLWKPWGGGARWAGFDVVEEGYRVTLYGKADSRFFGRLETALQGESRNW